MTTRCMQTSPNGWQVALAESIRSAEQLCRLLGLDPVVAAEAAAAADRFPLLAPKAYLARIRPGDPADPLLLQVLPRAAETTAAPGYVSDPLGEADARCGPGLLRKYQGRLLMVATSRCAVHCRFCFRKHFSCRSELGDLPAIDASRTPTPHCNGGAFEGDDSVRNASTNSATVMALEKIAADRSIHEVILSGGEPLTLPDRTLSRLAEQLAEIPHLRRLRIHTRLPIMVPERVTKELVSWMRGVRIPVIMAVHVNHPAEIDDPVAEALGRLADAGIPLLSQSVLLRDVNDRIDVLAALFLRLVDLRVIPYYLHQLDPVAGAAHFEVPVAAGVALMAELRARLPGYAVPRYVRETPGTAGKSILA